MRYNRQEFPKCLDPVAAATTVLSYSGYLKDSRMHGDGTLVTYLFISFRLNGDIYEGDFVKDQEEGTGTKTFNNHTTLKKYKGQWQKGYMFGTGKLDL